MEAILTAILEELQGIRGLLLQQQPTAEGLQNVIRRLLSRQSPEVVQQVLQKLRESEA